MSPGLRNPIIQPTAMLVKACAEEREEPRNALTNYSHHYGTGKRIALRETKPGANLDAAKGSVSNFLIRLRPSEVTPLFTFSSNTHLFVLEGSGQLQAAGAAATPLKLNWYAFVPKGFAISLSNPKTYSGPGSSQ